MKISGAVVITALFAVAIAFWMDLFVGWADLFAAPEKDPRKSAQPKNGQRFTLWGEFPAVFLLDRQEGRVWLLNPEGGEFVEIPRRARTGR